MFHLKKKKKIKKKLKRRRPAPLQPCAPWKPPHRNPHRDGPAQSIGKLALFYSMKYLESSVVAEIKTIE